MRNTASKDLREANPLNLDCEVEASTGLTKGMARNGYTDASAAADLNQFGGDLVNRTGDAFTRGGFLDRPNGWER